MVYFFITFVMFAVVEFLAVWWAKSIENSKAIQTGLAASGTMFLMVASMWIAFVGESISGAAGMVAVAGVGAYVGCRYFGR